MKSRERAHGNAKTGNGNTMETILDYRLEPPRAIDYPCCPCCGTYLYDYIVMDITGDVVGCSECTKAKSAEEYMEILNDEDF